MSYIEKMFVKRDNLEKYIKEHGAKDNNMFDALKTTDIIIQRLVYN